MNEEKKTLEETMSSQQKKETVRPKKKVPSKKRPYIHPPYQDSNYSQNFPPQNFSIQKKLELEFTSSEGENDEGMSDSGDINDDALFDFPIDKKSKKSSAGFDEICEPSIKSAAEKLHGKDKIRFLKERLPMGVRDNSGTFFASPGLFSNKQTTILGKPIFAKLKNIQIKNMTPFSISLDDSFTISFGNYTFPQKNKTEQEEGGNTFKESVVTVPRLTFSNAKKFNLNTDYRNVLIIHMILTCIIKVHKDIPFHKIDISELLVNAQWETILKNFDYDNFVKPLFEKHEKKPSFK